jgi:hypothetical protein
MLKPNTFIKATATTLAACMLMACGGEDSNEDENSNNDSLYTLSLESEQTGIVGKSIYTINVTDKDGLAVYGETPTVKPMMAMAAGHKHSSPHTGCTETDDLGNTDCTVYFLMPSSMGDEVMGTWTINIDLDDAESLSFVPAVTMPMTETVKVDLKDNGDTVDGTARRYTIFNSSAASNAEGQRSIELFITSKEGIMSFPALQTNSTLSAGSEDELSVDSIEVLVSADKEAETWTTATTNGAGVWTANIENYSTAFYVKLSVNGTAKKSGELDYATFKKAESMMMKDMADK